MPGNDIVIGRFGLRAGWGILFYLLLYLFFYAAVPILTNTVRMELRPSASQPQPQPTNSLHSGSLHSGSSPLVIHAPIYLLDESLLFAALALSAWGLARIEGRHPGAYGLSVHGMASRRLRDLLPGAFWGLVCMSLLIAALRAAHLLVFDARALTGHAIFTSGAMWLITFLAVGLVEEYLFRGYFLFTLTRGVFGLAERLAPTHARALAFWIAAVIMSCVFGAVHLLNPGENHSGILTVFLAGMVFSYALWRTGSLWWAIGFHMAWDWAQSFLYGVPDSGALSAGRLFFTHPTGRPLLSGGIDGPEGSLLVLPVFLLIALIIRFTTQPGAQPPLEPQSALESQVVLES